MEALIQHVTTLFYLAGLIFISAGIGQLLLLKCRVHVASFTESLIYAIGIGFGMLSLSVFAFCTLQVVSSTAVYLLLSAFAGPAIWGWRLSQASFQGISLSRFIIRGLDRWAAFLLLVLLGTALMMVLTPAFGNDELSYHLAVPRHYLTEGGFHFIPGNLFSNYPLGGEMLFLIGLAVSGDVLAKGIHFAMALLTMAAMVQFARRYLPDSTPRIIAPLVFISVPSVWVASTMAYTDLFLTAYAFLALYAFINWYEGKETAWLVLSGAMTGLALGSKYGGLILPFMGVFGVLSGSRRHRFDTKRALRLTALYALTALLIGSPFYLKNWILTANPLYPFFFDLFGGRGWSCEQARSYDLFLHQLGMGRTLTDYLLLPWNLSFHAKLHSTRFDGVIGPVFLLTLPFFAGLRKTPPVIKILILYAGFLILFWIFSVQQIRYLIPAIPALAILVGYTVSCYRKRKTVFTVLILLVAASISIDGYHIGQEFLKIKPHRYVIGGENRREFLSRLIPSYDIFQYVNTHLPLDAKIFLIYMKNLGFLCKRAYFSDSMFESFTIQKYLSRCTSTADLYDRLKKSGFTHFLYDDQFVFGRKSAFSQIEKERFAAFQTRYLNQVKTSKSIYRIYALGNR
ncbi:MAG: hypothetical protein C4530_13110 [Desulfobacteraceae bacterium]|nr:MAG: hypothetical protein C4530_13110 [Desulfobacteraceae bacterium]